MTPRRRRQPPGGTGRARDAGRDGDGETAAAEAVGLDRAADRDDARPHAAEAGPVVRRAAEARRPRRRAGCRLPSRRRRIVHRLARAWRTTLVTASRSASDRALLLHGGQLDQVHGRRRHCDPGPGQHTARVVELARQGPGRRSR